MKEFFELTENYIKLLQNAYVSWDGCEYGAPAIDCKRPYGNSSVEPDIAEIIGVKYDDEDDDQRAELGQIHLETQTALQIIIATKSFETGVYEKANPYDDTGWKKVE